MHMHALLGERDTHTHTQSVCVYTVNETIQTAPQTQNTDTDTDKHTPPHRHITDTLIRISTQTQADTE